MQKKMIKDLYNIKINDDYLFERVSDCHLNFSKNKNTIKFSTDLLNTDIFNIEDFLSNIIISVGTRDEFFIEVEGFFSNVKEDQLNYLGEEEKEEIISRNLENFPILDDTFLLSELDICDGKIFFYFEN